MLTLLIFWLLVLRNFNFSLCDRYNRTVFPLVLDRVNAPSMDLSEAGSTYPWLARLVPSLLADRPTLCTLACIKPRVYITAAKCILGLTVGICAVIHEDHIFKVKALVISDERKRTKEYFDDIGLVVISPNSSYTGTLPTTPVYSGSTRTDSGFQWLNNLVHRNRIPKHTVLAFYEMNRLNGPTRLYHLKADISVEMCAKMYTRITEQQDYHIPCAVTDCNTQRYHKYLGADCEEAVEKEGSIVYDKDGGFVFGVVSWGARDMPMGLAVPNSEAFYDNMECATLLSEDGSQVKSGRILRLCDVKSGSRRNHLY